MPIVRNLCALAWL